MMEYESCTKPLQWPKCKDPVDPLLFWKKMEHTFPDIAPLARDNLSIQATSTPSERMFKACGRVVKGDRCSLDPDIASDLTFCNQNLHLLDRDDESQTAEAQADVTPKSSLSRSLSTQRKNTL